MLGAGTAAYVGLVTGHLSVDLGVGRRTRPLGPLVVDIAAPRDVVYEVATGPYAERQPRAMHAKVQVLERGDGMVLAAHRTAVGGGLVAVTLETVTFDPPVRVGFRLVRGPVPFVVETFELREDAGTGDGTRLTYTGELGTDLGPLGELWGDLVARSWVATVEAALEGIRLESERRAR
ncbi:MAG: SRPBCC family protein [Nonomuraea sp.]|nr:SRPBCC family protein [Nonomuraea sp.]